MSKSFDVNVSFNFRAVFGAEALAEVGDAIQKMRAAPVLKPQGIALLKAYDEGGTEEALKFFLRDSMKQMRELVLDEVDKTVFKSFSPFTAVITSRSPATTPQVACVVPSQECDCNFCRGF